MASREDHPDALPAIFDSPAPKLRGRDHSGDAVLDPFSL
jgi:hypothetical protein